MKAVAIAEARMVTVPMEPQGPDALRLSLLSQIISEISNSTQFNIGAGWIPTRSATPATALVPQRKVGFPIPNSGLLPVSRGQGRLDEKEYRSHSVTPGVALRRRTQAAQRDRPIRSSNGLL